MPESPPYEEQERRIREWLEKLELEYEDTPENGELEAKRVEDEQEEEWKERDGEDYVDLEVRVAPLSTPFYRPPTPYYPPEPVDLGDELSSQAAEAEADVADTRDDAEDTPVFHDASSNPHHSDGTKKYAMEDANEDAERAVKRRSMRSKDVTKIV